MADNKCEHVYLDVDDYTLHYACFLYSIHHSNYGENVSTQCLLPFSYLMDTTTALPTICPFPTEFHAALIPGHQASQKN